MEAGLRLTLKWRPRDENTDADDLTDGKYGNFCSSDRIQMAWSDVDLHLLEQLWLGREEVLDRQPLKIYTGHDAAPYKKTTRGA